ncbi:hypothetical protein [Elizabethkingia anophelis]|uniref:hypothetical protein n=1 Tax=Elizabethkingia anophelis TaxID=1117645 RepID=UPI003892312E
MKKHLFYPALWGILTLSLFYSCRTDSATTEQTVASKEKIAAFERFEKQNNIVQPIAGANQTTTPQKYISYAKPFAEIITNFMQNHPDYAKWMDESVGVIRLDVASQTFGDDKKAIIFPVTDESGKVTGAWYGIINEERSYVNFSYMNDNSAELADIKKAFQNYYDKKTGSLSSRAVASISKHINPVALKNGNEQKPIDIEEVVITKKNPTTPPPDQWVPKYPDEPSGGGGAGSSGPGTGMSGGSSTHGTTPDPGKDPCSSMKDQREDETFKNNITDLKGKTGLKKETGYTQNGTTGKYDYQDNASATETSNSLRLPDAEKYNVKSYSHTHVDDYTYTDSDGNEIIRTGIKMFSPADVSYLMDMLRNAKTRGISFSDVSGTMVTSLGTYTIRFTGNEYQLKSFTETQVSGFTEPYKTFMTGNSNLSLEQKFLQFIDSKMNVKGVQLFKLNDDGTTTKTELNSDKTSVTTSNCP